MVKNEEEKCCYRSYGLEQSDQERLFSNKTIDDFFTKLGKCESVLKTRCSFRLLEAELDEESFKLCTFNIRFGRHRFLRVPFGIVTSSEIFRRVISQMVEDLGGCEAIMDGIVVWRRPDRACPETEESHRKGEVV